MVRKCEWECSEDLIDAGCGDILHMQGFCFAAEGPKLPNRDTHSPLSRHVHKCPLSRGSNPAKTFARLSVALRMVGKGFDSVIALTSRVPPDFFVLRRSHTTTHGTRQIARFHAPDF